MGFPGRRKACQGVAWAASDGCGGTDAGCGVKCRLVLHFRRLVLRAGIGVRTHFCGACWRTTSGWGRRGGTIVEALTRCHRGTSLALTGSGPARKYNWPRVRRSTSSMMPEHAGHRKLGGSGGSTQAVAPSRARQRASAALRLRLAKKPKWRMRTSPLGRTWMQEAAQELMRRKRS